ncbi:MAG: hypothetical protein P3X22_007525 [Thermoprotei archaeon]|nr:hypothetical protein [Thermoprotei archaeon]
MYCVEGWGPDWVEAVRGKLGSLDLLRVPGAPIILYYMGLNSIEIPGAPSLTWDHLGLYEVKVNGGGLIASTPLKPLKNIVFTVKQLNLEALLESLREYYGEGVEGLFNPLGWRLSSPLIVEGGSGPPPCYNVGGYALFTTNIEPLHSKSSARCGSLTLSRGLVKISLGPFAVELEGSSGSSGGLTVFQNSEFVAAYSQGVLTLLGDVELEFKHVYYDYSISYLGALAFHDTRIEDNETLESNAVSVKGPRGSIAIASPWGLRVEAGRGSLRISSKEGLSASNGGELEAFKLLLERSVDWTIGPALEKPVGHVRSYRAFPALLRAEAGKLVMSIINPTNSEGIAEIRLYSPVKNAKLLTTREELEMPPARGLITIAAPRGYCARLEIELGKPRNFLKMGGRAVSP